MSELEVWQQEVASLQNQVKELRQEANEAVRSQEATTAALINELEANLHREKQECQNLKTKIVVCITVALNTS
jgi:Type III secretion protein YscO.